MPRPIDVAVVGATGTVGARLVRLLEGHPWFRITEVGASDASSGVTLGRRFLESGAGHAPESVADLELRAPSDEWSAPLVLSALPSAVATDVEAELAARGHLVVSNASSHRMDEGVPLLVPEVNADHLTLLDARGDEAGGIVTNPNCVVAGLAVVLAPLHAALGLKSVMVTTFQAASGAGRDGSASARLLGNVLPHIPGEEDKIGPELRKILGVMKKGKLEPARFALSATCARVPVEDGHLASVSLAFAKKATPEEVTEILRGFRGSVHEEGLPLAPAAPVVVFDDEDRPQPALDRDVGGGMTVTVGRVRACEVQHVKLVVLSHNLVRGAAGAALLNAELCHARGLISAEEEPEEAAAPEEVEVELPPEMEEAGFVPAAFVEVADDRSGGEDEADQAAADEDELLSGFEAPGPWAEG